MKIKTILDRHRRDLYVVFVCEHCGYEWNGVAYDSNHYHREVLPKMECSKCGEKAGPDYVPMTPKYPDWMQV